MRLSMGDTVFPLGSDDLCLDIARGLGFAGVDLFAIPEMSRLKPAQIIAHPAATAAAVVGRYVSRGLAVSDFFPHPGGGFANPLAPNTPAAEDRKRSRDWFEAMLAFAVAIDSPVMTLMPGVNCRAARPGRLQSALKENAIDFPRLVASLAVHGYDAYLCCENIWFEPLGCDDVDNMSETIMLRDILKTAISAV